MNDMMPGSPGDTNPTYPVRSVMTAQDRLRVMIRTERGHMTVWSAAEVQAAIDAYRAEVEAAQLRKTADLLIYINPDRSADFSEGVDWAADELRRVASEAGVRKGGGQR